MSYKHAILLAAAVGIGAASQASAADMPVEVRPLPVVAAYDWTGFYIGAHGGGGWGRSDWAVAVDQTTFVDLPPGGVGSPLTNHRISGALAGGQIGYQRQFNQWVLGVEFQGSWSSIRGNSLSVVEALDDVYKTSVRSLFLPSVRLGYASDAWLVYAKGGYAGADVRTTIVDPSPAGTGSAGTWASNVWRNGWNAGVGVEYGFSPNVSVAAQYDHIDLGTATHSALGVTGSGVTQLWAGNIRVSNIDAITLRLNYRF